MIISDEKRTQLLSYLVHAGEILEADNHFPKHNYKYAYLPIGPELYTGVLKAAGYLFLDKKLEKFIIISKQSQYPNQIIGYQESNKSSFLIRGHIIKNHSNKYTEIQEELPLELFEQLLYSVLTNSIKEVIFLGVGTTVSDKDLKKKIKEIEYDSYGIIMLGNASEGGPQGKKTDKILIQHILKKNISKQYPSWFGNSYINIVKQLKGKPELVAYVHTSDLGLKNIHPIGFICAVV